MMEEFFADSTTHIIVIKDPHRYADERIVTQECCHENICWYFNGLIESNS